MIYDTSDTLKGELGFCQTTNMFNIYLKRCLKAILDLKDDGGSLIFWLNLKKAKILAKLHLQKYISDAQKNFENTL